MSKEHGSEMTPLIGRRKLLRGLGLGAAGFGAAALIGCSSDDGDEGDGGQTPVPDGPRDGASPTSTPQSDIDRGGVLRAGQLSDINMSTGYPFVSLAENPYLNQLPVEAVIKYGDSLEPEMVLAERYEMRDDLTGVSITLKPGLEFHNGASVTARDVAFGIELLKDPAAQGVSGSFQLQNFTNFITTWDIVDERTLNVTFDGPRGFMTDLFAQLMVVHRDSYEDTIAGRGVQGTGPYKFNQWSPGQRLTFDRFENYHAASDSGPHMDGVEVIFFADADAQSLSFDAGELDMFLGSPTIASRYRERGLTRLGPNRGLQYCGMNVTNPQLIDPRVRQALFYAVDRERFVNELGEGFGSVTAQPWPETSPAWREELQAPLYDPEKARELLRSAGFQASEPLQLDHRTGAQFVEIASVLKDNFEAIGVPVQLNAMEPTAFLARLRNREFSGLWVTSHAFSDLSPVTNFIMTFPYREGNMSYYETERYLYVIRTLTSLDPLSPEAHQQYDEFAALWLEEPWLIPLQPSQPLATISDRVQGFDRFDVAPSRAPWPNIWLRA